MTKDEILACHAKWTFQAPATSEQLAQMEQTLDLPLPADLREALLISNGLSIGDPEEYFANIAYFSIDQILSDTLHFRLWWEQEHEEPLPFDKHQMIIFNADDCGNPFALMPAAGAAHSTFLRLSHETGEAEVMDDVNLFDFVLGSAEMAEA